MISEKHDLTATQVKAYKETFDRLDLDGNGSLDMGEVRNAMYFWGQNLTDGELLAFFNKVRNYFCHCRLSADTQQPLVPMT